MSTACHEQSSADQVPADTCEWCAQIIIGHTLADATAASGFTGQVTSFWQVNTRGRESCRRPSVKPAWSLQVPEPDAEGLAQLQDMGFSAGLASKALLLSHNVPAAALEWALQHSGDADADAPASEDALRAGGARASGAAPHGRSRLL